ncbi:MAG: hypothetical protein KGL53_08650, partial [Elusimicrobia bacterium]|nr:hypothetical protein [Elusimicrobiota bacterium]
AAAILRRDTPFGESDILVEHYPAGSVSRADVAAHLTDGPAPTPVRHSWGGRSFEAYHDLRFTVNARSVGPEDPWQDSLGSDVPPPRLSLLEGRRFLPGGDAYRLYRCGRKDAWGLLADYRSAQRKGKTDAFLNSHGPEDRRVISACFGLWAAQAMSQGLPVPRFPHPGLLTLRARAREEWEMGVDTRRERECVVFLDGKAGGFWVLRLRAPAEQFEAEHPGFVRFAGSFQAN